MRRDALAILRLWLVLGLSYVLLQLAFNLAVLNRVDIRGVWFAQALVVPLGQSVVYWLIARRRVLVAEDPREARGTGQ